MKRIIKKQEPEQFTQWKAMANADWQPTYADLRGDVKQAVKTALMQEQSYICCYCERRLEQDDSHIEHFMPQSDISVDPLDFSNMLCSCQKELQHGEPRHCGNLKGNWFDKMLLISPLEATCETKCRYTADGHIASVDATDRAAQQTIVKLGLDIPKLRALRRSAIELFLDESLSTEDLRQFVIHYLQQEPQGMLSEFWTTIQQIFEDYTK